MSEKYSKAEVVGDGWGANFQMMSWWKAESIQEAKVMVIGAGAIGNEVLKNLALLGIGYIVVIDPDRVEYSNLSRSILFTLSDSAQYRKKVEAASDSIARINPNVNVATIQGDIIIDVGLGLFRRMDVIIGCVDNRLARLFINRYAFWLNKTWIDGSIEKLAGQINIYRPDISCYESNLNAEEWKDIEHKLSCLDIAVSAIKRGSIATTPIAASITAAIQVQEALKIICGYDHLLRLGKTLYYEGMTNTIVEFESGSPSQRVLSNDRFLPVVEAHDLSAQSTLKEFFNWLLIHFGEDEAVLFLKHEIVLEVISKEVKISLMVPIPKLKDYLSFKGIDISAKEIIITKKIDRITKSFDDQNIKLTELGIPKLDILKIYMDGAFRYIELTGDDKNIFQ